MKVQNFVRIIEVILYDIFCYDNYFDLKYIFKINLIISVWLPQAEAFIISCVS